MFGLYGGLQGDAATATNPSQTLAAVEILFGGDSFGSISWTDDLQERVSS